MLEYCLPRPVLYALLQTRPVLIFNIEIGQTILHSCSVERCFIENKGSGKYGLSQTLYRYFTDFANDLRIYMVFALVLNHFPRMFLCLLVLNLFTWLLIRTFSDAEKPFSFSDLATLIENQKIQCTIYHYRVNKYFCTSAF